MNKHYDTFNTFIRNSLTHGVINDDTVITLYDYVDGAKYGRGHWFHDHILDEMTDHNTHVLDYNFDIENNSVDILTD